MNHIYPLGMYNLTWSHFTAKLCLVLCFLCMYVLFVYILLYLSTVIGSPAKIYQFKSTQTIKRWELCWKSTLKIPERSYWHLLTSLLITLNLFHPFFSCFWCWLWTSKFLLREKQLLYYLYRMILYYIIHIQIFWTILKKPSPILKREGLQATASEPNWSQIRYETCYIPNVSKFSLEW